MKIAMYDFEGNFLDIFEVKSFKELETSLDIPSGSLRACIVGKQLSTINRQFRLVSDKGRLINRIGDISSLTSDFNKPVFKFYKGRYINTYSSVRNASEINGIDEAAINRCCKGKGNSAGGFEWKYAK